MSGGHDVLRVSRQTSRHRGTDVMATAFALAGLGGFNAHGAGFLTAASELGLRPDMVTATSGQIIVLAEWLRGTDLQGFLVDPQRPTGVLGTLLLAVTGDPRIFRPAVLEYWQRWARWPATPAEFAAKLLPAQEFVPLRSETYLGEIADLLNAAPFGVVFNAYDPARGTGALFGNGPALPLWPEGNLRPIRQRPSEPSCGFRCTVSKGCPAD